MTEPASNPVVTIGLPVYNGARLMCRAIDSVLAQDFAELELIISDNASTDATATIAGEYAAADPRVRFVQRERNSGAFDNFQHVLSFARGEMFSWISHDDFYGLPDHVTRLAEKIREGNTLAVPQVHAVYLDAEGKVVSTRRDMLAAFGGIRTRTQLARHAIRRSSVQIYGLYRTDKLRQYFHLLVEDADMICFFENRFVQAVLVNEPWVFVPEAQLNLGQHDASVSKRQDARRLLRDFLVYSARVLAMYRRNPRFTASERLAIYAEVMRVHTPYAVRLFGSMIKRGLGLGRARS
jgi:glycosyltransferase involved in cell wall biosynthesis